MDTACVRDDPVRRKRARKWRALIGLAGLALASTFFMPAVPGCNESIVPVLEVQGMLSAPVEGDLANWALWLLLFVAGYAWGLLISIAAIRRLAHGGAGRSEYGWGAYTVCVLAALLLIPLTVADLLRADWPGSPLSIVTLILCVGIIAHQSAAIFRLKRRAYLSVTFAGAAAASIWFRCWVGDGYYGVRLSFAASVAILLGVIGEAAVLTRRTWLGTLWRLITCRLLDADVPQAACPQCLYDLRGQTVMRCPECGRPFSHEELAMATTDPVLQTH